ARQGALVDAGVTAEGVEDGELLGGDLPGHVPVPQGGVHLFRASDQVSDVVVQFQCVRHSLPSVCRRGGAGRVPAGGGSLRVPAPPGGERRSAAAVAGALVVGGGTGAVDTDLQATDLLDVQDHAVSVAERSHSGRGAGRDHVARVQGHDGGGVSDQFADAEDEVRRVGALPGGAADVAAQVEGVRVRDLVGGHDPGAERGERVEGLAGGAVLAGADGDVQDAGVAEDVV